MHSLNSSQSTARTPLAGPPSGKISGITGFRRSKSSNSASQARLSFGGGKSLSSQSSSSGSIRSEVSVTHGRGKQTAKRVLILTFFFGSLVFILAFSLHLSLTVYGSHQSVVSLGDAVQVSQFSSLWCESFTVQWANTSHLNATNVEQVLVSLTSTQALLPRTRRVAYPSTFVKEEQTHLYDLPVSDGTAVVFTASSCPEPTDILIFMSQSKADLWLTVGKSSWILRISIPCSGVDI